MDVEEIRKFARNKIEAESLTKQVRDKIKTTIWEKNKIWEKVPEKILNLLLNLKIVLNRPT